MRVGAVCPVTELHGDAEAVRTFAVRLEELGFDHLSTYEHVLGADRADRSPPLGGPYGLEDPFHDPFVMFAHLAALTQRIEFATSVLVAPQRPTALLAKQAADLALMSGGRLRLGLGVGWNWVEYEALGQDFRRRGARLDEQIVLLRQLWTQPVVNHHGEFDVIERAAIFPRPAAVIPVWVGGFSPRAFERACRIGDGFMFSDVGATADQDVGRLRDLLGQTERGASFGLDRSIHARTPDVAANAVARWQDHGGTHATVVTTRMGLGSLQAHLDFLTDVAVRLGRA
jgi:probable F420-dependent oxidoreductase